MFQVWTDLVIVRTRLVTNMWGSNIGRVQWLKWLHHAEIYVGCVADVVATRRHIESGSRNRRRKRSRVDAVLHTLVLDEIVLSGEHPLATCDVAGDVADGILSITCPGKGANRVIHDGLRPPRLRTNAVFLDAARIDCTRKA
jgi:hypothetical protein